MRPRGTSASSLQRKTGVPLTNAFHPDTPRASARQVGKPYFEDSRTRFSYIELASQEDENEGRDLVKHKKIAAAAASPSAPPWAELRQVLASLTAIESELKTSTVSHSRKRLRQAAAKLAALLEEKS